MQELNEILLPILRGQNELNAEKTEKVCAASGQHDFQLPMDHVYPRHEHNQTKSLAVILYGAIGTPNFNEFHSNLVSYANSGEIGTYIVRHAPKDSVYPTALQGYGIALDIKNMEYKTIDDSKDSTQTTENDNDDHKIDNDDDDEGLDDFIISVFMKRKPDVSEALQKYQKSSQESASEKKRWRMKDLGLLALSRIVTKFSTVCKKSIFFCWRHSP